VYEDSGFKDPPYIARRADGQMIQMPLLLYLVAESIDGNRDCAAIGRRVSEQFGRTLDAAGASMLVEEKLRPLGIIAQPDGSTPELSKDDPLLALRMKTSVVSERTVSAITKVFKPLFLPAVVATVLVTFVALVVWLLAFHGVAQGVRATLYDPLFILLLLGLIVVSAAFHECGHATACAYGGARPGVMGVGIYLVWPAFYTDVTDAYRLGKVGRLRTDLGGVYFNAIFSIATFGAYFATGWEPLLLVIPIQIMEMLHQFLPFIRLDGYYIVSDLTGVPDMFARIKPTLKSLNPIEETPREVRVLKPWVRGAVTLYVCSVVPLLLFLLGLTAINVPRVLATAWDSLLLQNHRLHQHVVVGAFAPVAVDALQMAVLVLPVAGLFATFWKLGRTVFSGLWSRTEGKRVGRAILVAGTATAVFAAAYTWLPNGDYRRIEAAEAGTIGGGIRHLHGNPGRRPSPREHMTPSEPRRTDTNAVTTGATTPRQATVPGTTQAADTPGTSSVRNPAGAVTTRTATTPPATSSATTTPATTTRATTTRATTAPATTAPATTAPATTAPATTAPATTAPATTTTAPSTTTAPPPTTTATTTTGATPAPPAQTYTSRSRTTPAATTTAAQRP